MGDERRPRVLPAEDPADDQEPEVEPLAVASEAGGEAAAFGVAELDPLDLPELDLPDLAVERFAVGRVDPEDRVRLLLPLVVAI